MKANACACVGLHAEIHHVITRFGPTVGASREQNDGLMTTSAHYRSTAARARASTHGFVYIEVTHNRAATHSHGCTAAVHHIRSYRGQGCKRVAAASLPPGAERQ